MGFREAILDKELPTDDQVLAALQKAKASHLYPVQHIGNALQANLMSGKGDFPFFIKRYEKTLAWLSLPENAKWLQDDMPRVLNYLSEMSMWLKQNRP